MAILFSIIIIGYVLMRTKTIPDCSSIVLSKIENMVFMSALVFSTFASHFTPDKLNIAWKALLIGFIVIFISIPISYITSRFCTKDEYLKNIYTYGLAFSNFGFVGTAVVNALYPEIFMEYIIFVLPFVTSFLLILWNSSTYDFVEIILIALINWSNVDSSQYAFLKHSISIPPVNA